MSDELIRDFYLGFIRLHILHHACRAPVYGLELMEELGRHGYRVGPGTLYPILHALEGKGYLASRRQTVGGKVRRYYHATPLGQRVLKQAARQADELMREITEDSI
jgi:PadR family transcriptional regulator, regulatory protein PadR